MAEVREGLDGEQAGDPDRSRTAHPTQVVSEEVHRHDVLGQKLGVAKKRLVLFYGRRTWGGSRDGPGHEAIIVSRKKLFGRARKKEPSPVGKKPPEGRGSEPPRPRIGRQGVEALGKRRLEATGQVDLKVPPIGKAAPNPVEVAGKDLRGVGGGERGKSDRRQ
jgi:hypothetical protein